jgi:hypothetical protein
MEYQRPGISKNYTISGSTAAITWQLTASPVAASAPA